MCDGACRLCVLLCVCWPLLCSGRAPTRLGRAQPGTPHLCPHSALPLPCREGAQVVERLSIPGVRRLVVVQPDTRRVEGVISLSDVAAYLFL